LKFAFDLPRNSEELDRYNFVKYGIFWAIISTHTSESSRELKSSFLTDGNRGMMDVIVDVEVDRHEKEIKFENVLNFAKLVEIIFSPDMLIERILSGLALFRIFSKFISLRNILWGPNLKVCSDSQDIFRQFLLVDSSLENLSC